MKKSLFLCCCLLMMATQAQEKLDCDFNVQEALFYLKGDKNFKPNLSKSIEYLKPCLVSGNSNAQLVMGRIYAAKKDEKSYRKAFKLFKKAAKQGNRMAMGELGVLFKYGRGCNLNFNKARKWFKKGAELGDRKSIYSLGYLYLKGFGNIDQDYSKAVKWFQKTDHPMAKYWLGVCYYYGYGVEKNIQKAHKLFGSEYKDDTTHSLSVNSSTKNSIPKGLKTNTTLEETDNSKTITSEELVGEWSGMLLKFDWSGNHIEEKYPLSIKFKRDPAEKILTYEFLAAKQKVKGSVSEDRSLLFQGSEITLPYVSFDKRIPSELIYQFLSGSLKKKHFKETDYLIGNLESYIGMWNESGAPMRFVLRKKETFVNSKEELSDEALQALAEQSQNFIKLYPNPFESDLIISYKLDAPSFVEVKISDLHGNQNSFLERGKEQKVGKHSYFFNGSGLKKGIYVVTVIVNKQRKTRIIVKK